MPGTGGDSMILSMTLGGGLATGQVMVLDIGQVIGLRTDQVTIPDIYRDITLEQALVLHRTEAEMYIMERGTAILHIRMQEGAIPAA